MVTELIDGVWWLDVGGVNAYLVDDDAVTLVDAGMPWHGDDIVAGLAEAGFALADVERVLLTHYDLDHVGGLPRLDGQDVTVYGSSHDLAVLTGARVPDWRNHKGLLQRITDPLRTRPTVETEAVEDGDAVGSFTVYETPGHTPGHLAFVSESLSVAFLGDLVRESGGRFESSPWLLSHDTDAVRDSIRSLAERAPDFEVAAPGHGVPFERDGARHLRALAGSL
jgi:glyoxylase-like metal-dependent hydrolase (beta-lactamase superfamily II)